MPLSYFTKTSFLAAGLALATVNGANALDAGDAEKGEKVFKKCMACHMIGPEAKNKVGPVLNDVIGRTAGTFADYKYGKSIVAAGEAGLVWTEDEIFAYLANPKKYLRAKLEDKKAKSKMSAKFKKEEDRLNVIAYLKTFSTVAVDGGQEGEDVTEGDEVKEEESTTTD